MIFTSSVIPVMGVIDTYYAEIDIINIDSVTVFFLRVGIVICHG